MVHGKNRIPYRIDRRLTGLAGPDYDATILFGLPFESEDSRYGKYRLAERIARRMGLSEPEATNIYRAALVHDIGIVAVPSFVLNKSQDTLTEAEREQVRFSRKKSVQVELEQPYPCLGTIYSLCSVSYPNIR